MGIISHMCAQFIINPPNKDFESIFGIQIMDDIELWFGRIIPHSLAPVVTKEHLRRMNFSLIPSWSKERKPKFATHNARIESIDEKATWKKPFLTQHCLIPMHTFVEPIYEGDLAGNMVRFSSIDILIAAGVFDMWMDPATGEIIESFAIITSEPCEFVASKGHDRQPIFLSQENARGWLKLNSTDSKVHKNFLLESAIIPQLYTEIDRPMKAGWQKRIP